LLHVRPDVRRHAQLRLRRRGKVAS
jgi:hypothetical protein